MTTEGRRQGKLPCLDARGVEGWSCQTHDGTGLWCANCLANSTPDPEAGLRALVEKWKSDSLETQADYDARHPKMGYAKGLDDCAKQLSAYLATRTSGRRQCPACMTYENGSRIFPMAEHSCTPATPPEGGR